MLFFDCFWRWGAVVPVAVVPGGQLQVVLEVRASGNPGASAFLIDAQISRAVEVEGVASRGGADSYGDGSGGVV